MFKQLAAAIAVLAASPAVAQSAIGRDAVVARAEKMFLVADRNHDGWLSRDEYRAAVLATARRYDPKVAADGAGMQTALARFDALTAPSGGRISEQGFVAEATAHFDGADLNHDSTVTPDEARRAAARANAVRAKAAKSPR